MTTSSNLDIEHLVASASAPEVPVNEAFDLIDSCIADQVTIDFASDADLTLSTTGDAPQQWQYLSVKLTDTGVVLTTGRNVIVPDNKKTYLIFNSTAHELTVKTAAGTGIAVSASGVEYLYCDGTNVVAATGGGAALSAIVQDTSPQLGGDLDTNSNMINESKGSDIASASTLTIPTDGNFFDVTGTTTITAFSAVSVGTEITLQFDGALTLTHHATDLILPGSANITTAAGDTAIFREYATGDWHCINYKRQSGLPVVGSGVTDTDAVHFSTSAEYSGVSEKATPVNGDYLLIEDSAASYAKKYIQIGNLPGVSTPTESLIVPVSDETTDLTTGTAKVTFRMPYAFTLSAVRSSVTTAPTGSELIVDINESGTTILSTKLTIDAGEKTSTTAATAAVISDSSLADDAEMTIDIDGVGSTIAGAGLKVTLIGTQS